MTISLRGLARDDVPAWAQLLAAVEEVDRTGEHFATDDLLEEMDNPEVLVGRDFVGAFDGHELVGYCRVLPRGAAGDHYTVHVEGTVRPDRRGEGIGSTLVPVMLDLAREVQAERGSGLAARVTTAGSSSNTAQEDLLTAAGMTAERWTFVMRTALDDLPPEQPLPEGYALRTYDESMAVAVREAHNVAFLDHPNFTPWSETLWRQLVTGSRSFRPDLTFVVVEKGREDIVAYLQTAEYDAHLEATGRREAFVGRVGTLREHRKRGIAGALLSIALHAYATAGYDEASLDVDSENPTGALGVYRRAGFQVESRWTSYALEWPPVAGR